MRRFVGDMGALRVPDFGEPRMPGDLFLPGDLILYGDLIGEVSNYSIDWSVVIF